MVWTVLLMRRKMSSSSLRFFGRQGLTFIAHTEYTGRWTGICLPNSFHNTEILWNILDYFQNMILETNCEISASQCSSFTQRKQGLVIKDAIKIYCCQITKTIWKYYCLLAFWTCFCAWNIQHKFCMQSHRYFQFKKPRFFFRE